MPNDSHLEFIQLKYLPNNLKYIRNNWFLCTQKNSQYEICICLYHRYKYDYQIDIFNMAVNTQGPCLTRNFTSIKSTYAILQEGWTSKIQTGGFCTTLRLIVTAAITVTNYTVPHRKNTRTQVSPSLYTILQMYCAKMEHLWKQT